MSTADHQSRILNQVGEQKPYSFLSPQQRDYLFSSCKFISRSPGQTILRPDELSSRIYLVIEGKIRILAKSASTKEALTLSLKGPGQLIGWLSLLRALPSEWVISSEQSYLLSFDSKHFLDCFFDCKEFADFFSKLSTESEIYQVISSISKSQVKRIPDWHENLSYISNHIQSFSLEPGQPFNPPPAKGFQWFLSTDVSQSYPVGSLISPGSILPSKDLYKLPYRLLGWPISLNLFGENNKAVTPDSFSLATTEDIPGANLAQLGIREDESLADDDRYPHVYGKGPIKESLAACEMISIHQNVPFRRDLLDKLLDDQFRRDKDLSIQLLARLCEMLGLSCQLGAIRLEHFPSIEAPIIFILDDVPVVLYSFTSSAAIIGHPHKGIIRVPISEFTAKNDLKLNFAIPRRIGSTPTSRFGWNWFTPLIVKYKKSLSLVFAASLLAQLFGLAVPLLIQQIIDKVLTQGNLSSLNVLGTAMVVMALFQGILMALRSYIFVDTTDRMDLTLGSAVIDRLLALPLRFFDKRPVGELSQRLGELNTIRGFLTGTALVSVLNIIFASLYLVVMILYSPLLTVVALSTLPLYFLLVFGIAPLYKYLIRKRAISQARTQSHLIEVLSGIQTVKAQHFELTARWKWQDRYKGFVDYGFRSVALGSTSGEIGKFLSQISSLLVLWVGMWLVLQGDLTLGMLIAFRIISSNVTGPLLQLSSLYQGFQNVQISMERLSDIIDQNPELSREDDLNQIPLPPIKGELRFENVSFRFGDKGPFQVSKVNLIVNPGSFVGIVGQSGSGKSTLMKLLPRLYDSNEGRIFIDNYDISKVNLSSLRRQIGIVPQDSLLFEGTIADNISMNDPQASTESIISAAKTACAHDFIMSLGQGYATRISERGGNLSGGQRQRIAIARTILANPQLLIMDEATSALDYNTERQLCLNLQDWADDRTVLFITHRLNTIKNSDDIIVMHEGSLVEQGTHDELMKLGQRYSTLYRQQGE